MNKRLDTKVASDTMTGGEATVEMLKAHGVEYIFGLCGDTSAARHEACPDPR